MALSALGLSTGPREEPKRIPFSPPTLQNLPTKKYTFSNLTFLKPLQQLKYSLSSLFFGNVVHAEAAQRISMKDLFTAFWDPKALMAMKKSLDEVKKHPELLTTTYQQFQGKKSFVLQIVNYDGYALQFASLDLRKDRDVVLAAVKQDGLALQFASKELQKDWEIVLAAVKQNGLALEYTNKELQSDLKLSLKNQDVVLKAVSQDGYALQFASKEYRKDKRLVLTAVRQNGFALKFADKDLQNDPEVVLAAIEQNGMSLQFASKALRKNMTVVQAALKKNGLTLQFADPSLQKNENLVELAVKKHGEALQFTDSKNHNDLRIVRAAVMSRGWALKYAGVDCQNDFDIVLIAVKDTGWALQFASEELRGNREIVLAAIEKDADSLFFASETLRNDPEMIEFAKKRGGLINLDADNALASGLEAFKVGSQEVVHLFAAMQQFKDGAIDETAVGQLIDLLNQKRAAGVLFGVRDSSFLSGGTCSAESLSFAKTMLSQGEIKDFADLEKALNRLSTEEETKICITRSCDKMRNIQMALNAIRVSRSGKNKRLDFSRSKAESLVKGFDFSIGKQSQSLSVLSYNFASSFEKELEALPEGTYFLRALRDVDNLKMELYGHSMILIKTRDCLAFYDPSVGLKVARPEHLKTLIRDAIVSSLKRYRLDSARLYQLINT